MTAFQRRLESFPPFLVRLAARRRGRRMTRREIAHTSGLSGRTVDRLSRGRSWNNVTAAVIFAYTEACGVDLMNLRAHRDYLKRRGRAAWLSWTKRIKKIS